MLASPSSPEVDADGGEGWMAEDGVDVMSTCDDDDCIDVSFISSLLDVEGKAGCSCDGDDMGT